MTEYEDQARRFNEDAAVLRVYERLRAARLPLALPLSFPETSEEQLDWEQALRECGRVLLPGQQLHPFPL